MANPTQVQQQPLNQQIAKFNQLQELLKQQRELLSQITDPELLVVARKLVNDQPESATASECFRFRSVMLQTAYQCVQAMDESTAREFVARGLLERMQAAGYEFTGNAIISIQPALQALIREKIIEVVKPGAGRRATVYKRSAPANRGQR